MILNKEEDKIVHRRHFDSPVGTICIEDDGEAVTALYLGGDGLKDCDSGLLDRTEQEIREYFDGKRKVFDIPLHLKGTEFQKKVWAALQEIPYGETRSYSELAAMAGNPAACRAVGGANHHNPVMILVPCHRVIGKNGDLTGFGGGLEVKKYLLDLEAGMV